MWFFRVSSKTLLQANLSVRRYTGFYLEDTRQKASLGRQKAGYSMLKITHPRIVGMNAEMAY